MNWRFDDPQVVTKPKTTKTEIIAWIVFLSVFVTLAAMMRYETKKTQKTCAGKTTIPSAYDIEKQRQHIEKELNRVGWRIDENGHIVYGLQTVAPTPDPLSPTWNALVQVRAIATAIQSPEIR